MKQLIDNTKERLKELLKRKANYKVFFRVAVGDKGLSFSDKYFTVVKASNEEKAKEIALKKIQIVIVGVEQ
jgi:Fe-S cluster assembly iron-binding protein IscA